MLDCHTHILPGIDDGAHDLTMAIGLCQLLAKQGVTEVVATPHWCSPRFEVDDRRVLRAWKALSDAVQTDVPGLILHLGSEHHLSGLQQPSAFVSSLRPLGSSSCVLVELPDDHVPHNAWQTLREANRAGYRTYIAHPERCRGLSGAWGDLEAFIALGGRLQFDLGNLLGTHGWRMRWRARRLFAHFAATSIIASDCHNLGVRAPQWDRLPAMWRRHVPATLAELEGR